MKAFLTLHLAYCLLICIFLRWINNKINKLNERALRIDYKDQFLSFEEFLSFFYFLFFLIGINSMQG